MDNVEQFIDNLHLEDLKNELHPSVFDENEGYDMLIIRLPSITKELQNISHGFIITPEQSFMYNSKEKRFEVLSDRFEAVHTTIDKMVDEVLKSFMKYQDLTAQMEDVLYQNMNTHDFIKKWLRLKLEISKIERTMLRASETISMFIDYNRDAKEFPLNHYADLHEHIDRSMRYATLQLLKLNDLYSFYNAKTNDKMNRMIYILTIISAIFLPMHLIVGFFGMNTSGLPFTSGTIGTSNVLLLMLVLMILTSLIVYRWRKKVENKS
ncbi:magnesium transporter [bacterium]|nr:magnesium transporter [bacterium]MBU1989873.1 magnesium transporter [bacterium]